MGSKRIVLGVIIGIILLSGVGLSVFLVKQNQDVRSHADTSTTTNTTAAIETPTSAITVSPACQVPPATQNVHIDYPHCDGPLPCTADLTKADCTWDAVTGATSYTIQISQVAETGATTPIKSDTVSGATKYTFDVVQNNTYECSISPVSTCGTGAANAVSLLCAAGNTTVATATPAPAATLVPTVPLPTAVPAIRTLPSTGSTTVPMVMGIGGILLVLGGGILILGL